MITRSPSPGLQEQNTPQSPYRSPSHEVESIKPYADWLQNINLDRSSSPTTTTSSKLRVSFSGINKRMVACVCMVDSVSPPARIFAKVSKVGATRVSFEVVNCYTRIRYLVQADMNSTFPFNRTDFPAAFDDVPKSWCDETQLAKDLAIWSNGDGYMLLSSNSGTPFGSANEKHEGTREITTNADHGNVPEEAEGPQGEEEEPEEDDDDVDVVDINDDGDDDEEEDDDSVVPVTEDGVPLHLLRLTTSPPPKPSASNLRQTVQETTIEQTPQYLELQKRIKILEGDVTSLNAQLIVEKVESTWTKDALTNLVQKKTRFDIYEYTLCKYVANSYNGRLYEVEHTSGKRQILKEIISLEGDATNELKNITIANELALLRTMQEPCSENLLRTQEVHIDHTPLRRSHYLLSEPATLSLEEFANTTLQNCDQVVPFIIGAQILSGLVFLKGQTNRVHGNLTPSTVLVDFFGTIKLSCFEFSFPIGTELQPTHILSDVASIPYKHTHMLECRDVARSIFAWPVMDIWSVGCIMFRLLNGHDLFATAPTVETRLNAAVRAFEEPVKECVGDLFIGYTDMISPELILSKNVFAGLQHEKITNHFIARVI